MYKIAHISDTHIRNLKYHKEYRTVFGKIFETLKEEKPDYIVHCGDIAHTKTQISPEFVEMCAWFFKSLSEIAPTIVILGNHDGNLKNSSRQDALTPIVNALNLPNLRLVKQAGELPLTDDLTMNVLSVFDEKNWQPISDSSKINIALYHGSVSGVKTDAGFVMEHGDHDISIFEGFDYVMLGDIHKTNQALDNDGRVRYPGSTVQQNHGETNDKGFLIWEIVSKDLFEVRHIAIPNPSPFFTIELTETGTIPKDIVVPDNARLRLAVGHKVSLNAIRKSLDTAKTLFKPISVTFFNKSSMLLANGGTDINLVADEDLRDIQVQERIMKDFLEDYHVEEDVLEKILELNRKYHVLAEQQEDVVRNVRWSVKKLTFDNLFSFGSGNSIDFGKLNGVVGIFGKNFIGKSSIIDSLLWTLFNSTSKSFRKNVDIINQNKAQGRGTAEIQIGQRNFVVERKATKMQKKTRAGIEIGATTTLDFGYYDPMLHTGMPDEHSQNVNGDSRPDTDKNIRRMLGTIDDFLLTSMSSQRDSLSFVYAKSTERKQILAKFLDLEIFEQKFQLANEDALNLRGALKKLEGRDFDTELTEVQIAAASNERSTSEYQLRIDILKKQRAEEQKNITDVDIEISKVPNIELVDEDALVTGIETYEAHSTSIGVELDSYKDKLISLKENQKKYKELLDSVDLEQVKTDSVSAKEAYSLVKNLAGSLALKNGDMQHHKVAVSALSEVPCGDQFPECKFLQNAHVAKGKMAETEELIQLGVKNLNQAREKLESYDDKRLQEIITEYRSWENGLRDVESETSKFKLKREKAIARRKLCDDETVVLKEKLNDYLKNKKAVKFLKTLYSTKKQYLKVLNGLTDELEQCQLELTELWKEHGSLEQKWNSLDDSKLELAELREQYAAYDLYLKCMHGNGIAYDIIKKRLPIINEQVAQILANVVDFEVFLDDDGKQLPIMIRHPKYPPRSLEGGSGAEMTLAAMAIRLALIRISSLPVGDLFILDEPATSLDEENMEGFTRIVEMLKMQFKTIILVSHLDALKDIVDTQIVIDKQDGYAQVNA
ncbi:MAG TPA: metallophosphoesterase [Patescibacteria group bacterium]|nr:metallophosphoesterase [Patescibacteria group bacterium]